MILVPVLRLCVLSVTFLGHILAYPSYYYDAYLLRRSCSCLSYTTHTLLGFEYIYIRRLSRASR